MDETAGTTPGDADPTGMTDEQKRRDQLLAAPGAVESDADPRIEVSEHNGNTRIDIAPDASVRPGDPTKDPDDDGSLEGPDVETSTGEGDGTRSPAAWVRTARFRLTRPALRPATPANCRRSSLKRTKPRRPEPAARHPECTAFRRLHGFSARLRRALGAMSCARGPRPLLPRFMSPPTLAPATPHIAAAGPRLAAQAHPSAPRNAVVASTR